MASIPSIETLKELRNLDKDSILGALGLETKTSGIEYVLPVLGIFGAGLLTGLGAGLLLAPKAGRELREDIGRRVSSARERAMSSVNEVAEEASAH